MNYPPNYGYRPPAPPPSSGPNVLVIVLIVLVVALILGGGGCLLCIGIAASTADTKEPGVTTTTSDAGGATNAGALERTATARQIEQKMRSEGVPVQSILCPKDPRGSFTCELVSTSGDRADVVVTPGGSGLAYDVPNTAFLDGAKLTRTFAGIVAGINPRLRATCFVGTLMKKVATSFVCDVVDGVAPAGKVTVTVNDSAGNVHMEYEGPRPTGVVARKRTVDFVCPPGKKPGGAVRAGCLCGDDILGTACGAPGSFTDVSETPTGCRFVCN